MMEKLMWLWIGMLLVQAVAMAIANTQPRNYRVFALCLAVNLISGLLAGMFYHQATILIVAR